MTDRGLMDQVAEALKQADISGDPPPDEHYRVLAQVAVDVMQLTPQTRDVWPPEESGVPGPLRQTCWQTPWVVADD